MKSSKKQSNLPKILIGAAIVGIIAYVALGNDSGPVTPPKGPAKHKTTATDANSLVTDADRNATRASFNQLALSIPDRFVPLVSKVTGGIGSDQKTAPSELTIPTNFTGGEANWAFTGTVDVNGKRSALVENTTSAQNAYLSPGEKWKSSTVKEITENILILRDISGAEKQVRMQADVQAEIAQQTANLAEMRANVAAAKAPSNPNAPMNPNMQGPIAFDPSTMSGGAAAVAASQGGGNGGNGRQGFGGYGNGGNGGYGGRGRGGRGGGGRGGRGGFGNGGG